MSWQEENIRTLDDIIKALRSGRYKDVGERQTELLCTELEGLRSSGQTVEDGDLKTVFASNLGLLTEVSTALAEKALAFVKEQVARFEEVKKQRPFTAEEKAFAAHCLVPLLAALSELVNPKAPS